MPYNSVERRHRPQAAVVQVADGPSLQDYVETRFDLLSDSVKTQMQAQADSVQVIVEASRIAALAVRAASEAAQAAADLRYQQRFEAQSDALAAAFLSQQTAMQTALKTAQEAVQAALAAADRAVSKAELAADKRFEALNELRNMLNETLTTLMTRPEAALSFAVVGEKEEANRRSIAALDARLNTLVGEATGGQRGRDNFKSWIVAAVAIVTLAILIAGFLLRSGAHA
jgi:hypothetical protein